MMQPEFGLVDLMETEEPVGKAVPCSGALMLVLLRDGGEVEVIYNCEEGMGHFGAHKNHVINAKWRGLNETW